MEFKADALLLRAADYRESDRIVTLLTAERGKVSAGMRGVRKAGAKLNFAAQPFCFAEYVMTEHGGRCTVTQAALHDGFFGLTDDLTRYYAGAAIVEAASVFSMEGMPAGELLIAAVSSLKEAETADAERAVLSFLLKAVSISGYPVSAGDCPFCEKELHGKLFFDFAVGAFNCADCARGVPASGSTLAAVRAVLAGESVPEGDGAVRALRLMKAYITYQTDARLNAAEHFLGLL